MFRSVATLARYTAAARGLLGMSLLLTFSLTGCAGLGTNPASLLPSFSTPWASETRPATAQTSKTPKQAESTERSESTPPSKAPSQTTAKATTKAQATVKPSSGRAAHSPTPGRQRTKICDNLRSDLTKAHKRGHVRGKLHKTLTSAYRKLCL